MIGTIIVYFQKLFGKREKPELSFSRVRTYQECPYRYRLIYLQRLHAPPTPYSALGSSIHSALELYHTRKGASWDDLFQAYNDGWEHDGFADPQQEMEFYRRGEEILKKYFQNDRDRNSEILFSEKDFRLDLKFCFLRGIIDRIDRLPGGKIEILDYKTHKQMWKKKDIQQDLQMTIYSYAYKKQFGRSPDILSYYFLSHEKKISTERGKKDEKDMLNLLKEVSRGINKNVFPPKFKYCWKCDFKGRCEHANKKNSSDHH